MPFWNKEPKNVFDWETGLGDVTTWKEDWVLDTLKQVDLLGSRCCIKKDDNSCPRQ